MPRNERPRPADDDPLSVRNIQDKDLLKSKFSHTEYTYRDRSSGAGSFGEGLLEFLIELIFEILTNG